MVVLKEGVNFVQIENIELPIFYSPAKNKNSRVLWILFSAGGPRRKNNLAYPTFDRVSWAKGKFQGECLIFEDPSYYYNKGIQDGWYLGTGEKTYYQLIAQLLTEYIQNQNINSSNLRFFGSSTGGTAAICVSSYFLNSISIASNPQIDISLWSTYKSTCSILQNTDLQLPVFIKSIINNTKSKIFISFNIGSDSDRIQAQQLFSYMGITDILQDGIFQRNNIYIWLYSIFTEKNNPHNVFPTFGMLLPIEQVFFNELPNEVMRKNFSYYSELLKDYYELNEQIIANKK